MMDISMSYICVLIHIHMCVRSKTMSGAKFPRHLLDKKQVKAHNKSHCLAAQINRTISLFFNQEFTIHLFVGYMVNNHVPGFWSAQKL